MSSSNRRILVVEDDIGLQKLMQRRAEHAGFEVVVAVNGVQALALATTASPALVLLDIHLPDCSGVQVLARLKADPRTAHIPVVLWSGSGPADDATEALRRGDASFFEKTDLKALMAKIAQLLDD